MDNQTAKELIDKYKSGQETAGELTIIEKWIVMGNVRNMDLSENELEHELSIIRSGLPLRYMPKQRKLWPRITAVSMVWKVAAAVAAITLGVWLYYTSAPRHLDDRRDPLTYSNDIAPGKNTATLTLANGKVITLDTNKTNVVVTDSVKTMTMLTASTPRGGQYQVVLPDGTRVWLNADSKISFPSQFNGRERKVLLTSGEAYFEVARDKAHPFIVQTDKQEVEVLGTHFNINSYQNEPVVATTLVEGSVRVTSGNDKQILKPGQQALNNGVTLQVSQANVAEAIAWKDGDFQFNEEKMSSIVRKLERWYDVEIELSAKLAGEEFTGKIARNRNISRVLRMMEKTNSIHFKIEGRRITAIEK